KIGFMNALSKASYDDDQLDSAQMWAERAKVGSERADYPAGLAESLRRLGVVAAAKSDTTAALTYYRHAIRVGEAANATATVAFATNSIASIYYRYDDYANALVFYERALAYFDQLDNLRARASAYQNIGNSHDYMGNAEAA